MDELLRFQPLYFDRVWGGRALETALGRPLPPGGPIGESWDLVDRPEAQSVICGGTLAGQTLQAALHKHSAAIMGPGWPAGRPFPLLVKWLDCRERLSLQVHPPADVAGELGGDPKTENWFITDTSPGAHLIVGLKRGVTRDQFERGLAAGTAEQYVERFPVVPGDSILVRSGQLHAIDAGCLILEIQQNSDTTYRVFDWGRMGLDGKPRTLHVAQSLRSILWDDAGPALVRAAPTAGVIAECPEFLIRRLPLAAGEKFSIAAGEQPRLLSVVAGSLRVAKPEGEALVRGDNVLLPRAGSFVFEALSGAIVLVTENFYIPSK
ncbi:MAG TPA: type I phosphomannose isomerase catalytic subunit [Opitutaceae bacterium]|jgi:mannose-6-phosphate isomerase|nr:type I phosphomannose isomerase catalytic subunit [Opitutaceae bacterium]